MEGGREEKEGRGEGAGGGRRKGGILQMVQALILQNKTLGNREGG